MAVLSRGKVWLDGVALSNVVSFNIAEGWVDCNVTSPSNYCNKDVEPDSVLQSRLYGHIEFKEERV